MAKHDGRQAKEPKTNNGKAWDEMTPEEKAAEFDASDKNPRAYARDNFRQSKTEGNTRRYGFGPKHKKK
jgi:hypothetical protein